MSAVASFERISLTAKFVAYLRTFSDIRYSGQIALACDAGAAFKELLGRVPNAQPNDFLWMAPGVELRYKSVDALLKRYQFANVVELAAGVSPRGLIWTGNPAVTYLETDLPEILLEKQTITSGILGSTSRPQLKFLALDATNRQDFTALNEAIGSGPVAILCEGLLPYLDRREMGRVAANIYQLFQERPRSIWITPDLFSGDRLTKMLTIDSRIGEVLKAISDHTGRDLKGNSFPSQTEAEGFFRDYGFEIKTHDQLQLVPNLTSLERVVVDPAKVDAMCQGTKIWTMEA